MIEYIKNICRLIFSAKKAKNLEDRKTELKNGIISFAIDKKDGILIHCLLPKINNNIDSIDPEIIATEAERFAEMLLCVNEGLLKKEIINVLKHQYEIEDNINQKLLIENILNFWSILYDHYKVEKKKSAKEAHKMPLIRPMAVFSAKR
jgi:hypothetical protein